MRVRDFPKRRWQKWFPPTVYWKNKTSKRWNSWDKMDYNRSFILTHARLLTLTRVRLSFHEICNGAEFLFSLPEEPGHISVTRPWQRAFYRFSNWTERESERKILFTNRDTQDVLASAWSLKGQVTVQKSILWTFALEKFCARLTKRE